MFKIKCAGQKKSTPSKDENGLPCCDGEDPDAEPVRLIGSDDTVLQRLNEPGTSPAPAPAPAPDNDDDNEPEEGE